MRGQPLNMKNILGLRSISQLIARALPPDTSQVIAEMLEKKPEIFQAGCQVVPKSLERIFGGYIPLCSDDNQSWFEIAIAWHFTQNVALFDTEFSTELRKTTFSSNFPVLELLRLVGNPVYIPLDKEKKGIFGYIVCVSGKRWESEKSKGTTALLSFIPSLSPKSVPFTGFTLKASGFGLIFPDESEKKHNEVEMVVQSFKNEVCCDDQIANEIINKLIFLLSDEPEATKWRESHLSNRPTIKKHKRRADTIYAPSQPKVHMFGVKFGDEIRKASAELGTDRTVRPHIRSAHWHTFLAGPDRSKRVVRWLKPIFVHSRQASE